MAQKLSQVVPDGVFKAKFNTDSDSWSVILPYLDRQKYTIGEKYTSWETQGEFVFFKTKAHKWNWNFGLEIFCDLNSYWVKPVEGGEILKNGEMLDDKTKTRLNFGDIITVMKLRNDISGGLAFFSFEKREYTKISNNWERICESDSRTGLSFTPDKNQLIFSEILSHLSVRSLKNARLVCRHWDEQVSPILHKKTVIKFEDWSEGSKSNPSLKFFRYVHDMRNVADWPNWMIRFPNLPPKEDLEENWAAKYVTDLTWFLQPRWGHHVKTLSLRLYVHSDQNYGLYLDTVSRLEDTLEELCLGFDMQIYNVDGTEKEYSSRPGLFFRKLKKFSFCFYNHAAEPDTLTASWMGTWADAITRVTSISIDGYVSLGSRFLQELQTTGTSEYANLTDISATWRTDDAINFLTELNQPLRKMTLAIPLKNRHLPDFENLLKKFAPSLELLSFRISTGEMEEKSHFVLNMPCLPKLKSLDLQFGHFEDFTYFAEGSYVGCDVENEARLSLTFPPGPGGLNNGIDYGRHLPEIRSIVVAPELDVDSDEEDDDDVTNYFWDTYSNLIDSLLPKEKGHSCKTLQNLVILKDDIELATRYGQAARLPEIFPNVRNGWMARLRGKIDK